MKTYQPPEDLYPFSSNWLETGGHRLHYIDEGPRDAPVVLMVHGNPTWSFYYRNLVNELRTQFRCIVPDHIGCGLSDKPGDDRYRYQLDQRVEDLQTLISGLEISTPINLVVHDWGGMIGYAWATRYKIELDRQVVLNTAAFPMPETKSFPLALWLAGKTPLGTPLVRGLNAFSGMAARIAFKKPVSKRIRQAYTGPYNNWQNRIATQRFVQDIPLSEKDPGYDIVARTGAELERYAQRPALMAWGMKDFVFDHHFLAVWKKKFPQAEVLEYPDCGHYILEDAAPDLIKKIATFLQAAGNELERP